MCDKLFVPIKAISRAGVRAAFVPCGKCEDCRQAMKNSWVFRLRVELDKLCEKGWQIGFYTLTYNEYCLPHIPHALFNGDFRLGHYPTVACFSKSDVRAFFTQLKKFFRDHYNCRRVVDKKIKKVIQDTALRYMLCSEYGEHTQRPHYHGIICFPPNVPSEVLFNKIHELWTFGFVFPKDFYGGYDSRGYLHKPFVCSSVKAAALYAAKYCCKDLAFLEYTNKYEFRKKFYEFNEREFIYHSENDTTKTAIRRKNDYTNPVEFVSDYTSVKNILRLSDYMPFHYQSKSLGKSFLDGLTDARKLEYYRNGYAFVGDDRAQGLPVYLKNKIVFDNKYIVENGKRLCRREAKAFFRENLRDIYDAKLSVVTDSYEKLTSVDYLKSLGVSDLELDDLRRAGALTIPPSVLADWQLAYYGVPRHECYLIEPSLQWFRRYDDEYVDVTNCPLVSETSWQEMHYIIGLLHHVSAKYLKIVDAKKRFDNREIDRIHDYWVSME
ncbi:replication initiator protein [Blackfly microvirus SF02]|uniref:Replication initiator protein n=1 Tax=Blackfly microvirus SF02 TaxID=2576452 RepID=A0A4P8PJS4_9VIRU|nr:replication initiator protein [Blackfly microvirus SF02]